MTFKYFFLLAILLSLLKSFISDYPYPIYLLLDQTTLSVMYICFHNFPLIR